MVGFAFDDNPVKSEKTSSFTARFCDLGEIIKKLFRITEIIIVLALLTWASTRLPFAVRISGEYLRRLINIVVSHLFVFLLSNVIVLVLFFKSRALFLHHDSQVSSETETHVNFCQEFIASGGGGDFPGEKIRQPEEIVYQDKQTILEVRSKVRVRRSQSEIFRRSKKENCGKQLRRSETERQRSVEAAVEVVEELSNEEFERAIDAFIAKQIKFHQEEKLAIVLHGCS